jgi:hypothetical protein
MKRLLVIAVLTCLAVPLRAQVSLGDAVDATNLVWTSGGNVAWLRQTAVTHDGVDAAQSGAIFDYQESWLQTTVTGPGTLTFWWRVSSEFDFDWLRFHIDGVMQHQISGEIAWQQRSHPIPAGSHVLRWRYVKDANTVAGSDRAWVDQVNFTPAAGAPIIASEPASVVAWEGANINLQAIALGAPPLSQRWYFNETNEIVGATNAMLVISNALPAHAGGYRLVASNALGGPVTSVVARVTLTNNAPVNRIILFVDSPVASPYEAALTDLGMSYERVFGEFELNNAVNGANRATTLVIVDAPQNSYTFTSFNSFINGGGRMVIGANSLIGVSSLAALFKVAIDVRLESPQRVYDWRGSPLFTGLASSIGFVEIGLQEDVHRWHALPGGYPVAGFGVTATPGAGAVVIGNDGRTIVNGFWMGAASPAANGVQLARNEILFLTGPVSASAPVIRIQPQGRTTAVGRSATMQVLAWGAAPLSYEWYLNETNAVPGATAAVLTLPSVQLADAGSYTVVVSNSFGSVTSSPAILTVNEFLPVPTTLLFADFRLTSPWEPALIARGYPYQLFTDEPSFNAAVSAADPDTTLVVVDAINFSYTLAALPGYVGRGGRAILQYWNVAASSALTAAFQISVGASLTAPEPGYDWGGSPFFDGVNSPLPFLDYFNSDGLRLQPSGGARAVAGFTPGSTAGQAAIVIGNSGRTIAHGIWLEVVGSFPQAVRLARNELDFLIAPMPPTAPFITTQPPDSLVVQGNTGLLKVSAGGTLPLTYQWRRDGVPLPGETNEQLRLPGAQFMDVGSYEVVVSNPHGTVTSRAAVLVVSEFSPITGAVLFRDGPYASPYAEALNNLGIPFQEVSDDAGFNAAMALADPASTLVVVDCSWEFHYLSALEEFVPAGGRVILQDWTMTQAKSSAALFRVMVGAPFYFPQPVYDWGGNSMFAGITSPLTLSELFNINGRLMQPTGGEDAVAGYTAAPSANQAAIVVGNEGRTIVNGFVLEEITPFTDSVQLAMNEIEFMSPRPPEITVQPQSLVVALGVTTNLSVTARGSQPLSYQWYKDGAAVPGASSRIYTITGVQSNHLGAYTVVVSNPLGVVTSQVARLDVGIRPVVVQGPISQTVVVGGSVTFSVEITGHPPPFNYEWRKSSPPPIFTNRFDSNERVSFFTLNNVTTNMAGAYRVVIRNLAAANGVSPPIFNLTVLADADGDGVPDVADLNPGLNDATLDADHDGQSNLEEYLAGTDPSDPQSYLKIERIEATGSATLWFNAASNKTYTVEYTDALGSAGWSKLADVVAHSTNGTQSVADPASAAHRSYRLVTPRRP